MSRTLRLYLIGLVGAALVALLATSLFVPVDSRIALFVDANAGRATEQGIVGGILFWTALALVASSLPVQLGSGVSFAVSTAPLMASALLGGPTAAAVVGLIGSTDLRELRGRVAWYGTLANHAGITLPAIIAAFVIRWLEGPGDNLARQLGATLFGTLAYFVLNLMLVSAIVNLRRGLSFREFLGQAETANIWTSLLSLAPLAWLMARTYELAEGWWATLLFALPLFTIRIAYQRFVQMREMFTQTIGALAEAVDKRDPYTSKHSQRVRLISVDIGRQLRVSAAELEALEWGGLLHDVGKIGVPDNVLLKQGKLTREERITMNAHPVKGAEIIGPVSSLAPELPVIRHHHEWYNGSGYPDRLMGDEIPRLARILHVADAFEAMTADRPYRKALSKDQGLAELRKFAGVQFDPEVVDAFVKTAWADEARDSDAGILRPIPLLGQVAARNAAAYDAPAPGSPAADLT
ncbi:MAG TPA: HD-GYP domain-containing protein [Candidatus Limnocylindrales bacterium]|nr:HD-GYP domain-containing protein [Candidatus Limnocylindrales bacterium]